MNEPIKAESLKDVSLVIATYNEEECIKYVLDELQQFDLGEIIIVDGNSTDNTKAIAEKYDIKFISQSKNGWGSAVKEGIGLTTLPIVTYMDGDGSYNPKALIEMRNLIDSNDGVFCSRYKDGAKSPDDTPIRAWGNKIFTLIVRVLFGPKISDSLFFYPMFKKTILNNFNLDSDDFTLCLELPVKVHQMGLKYVEILSEERERYAGVSKVNALTDGFKILLGIFALRSKL
ncbi:MAG: glycosyltransferase family 2 protein [Flavobacteriaceae bacterium TMED238]|nr:MAG: glycosyltransferase family 2 protein [Flavobacteriaceae bacterium TMED238]